MSSPLYAHHKLLSLVIAVTLAVSFAIPAWAQEALPDDSSAYVSDEEAAVDASQADIETAHTTGCAPVLTLDQPGNGSNVTGVGLISGWFGDTNDTFSFGGGPIDIYRGDTFITSTSTGASRDVGNVRPDVDSALGITDGRAGWFVVMDWSRQPGGSQTYRVLGRSHCEWTEARFTVNVNPAPPAPAAGLSINDVSRSISTNSNLLNTCTVVNQFGQCTGVGTTSGFGSFGTGCLSVVNGVCIGSSIGSSTASDVNFDFTVTLSPASTQTVQVDWTTADGSAVSGTDYQAGSGTLTFNPGDTTKTITVRAFSRNVNDISSRDFLVRLSNPRNASISDSEGRGRIERSGGSSCGSIVNGVCTNTGIGTSGCTSFINGVCVTSGFGTTSGVSFQTTNVTCGRNTTCSFTIQNFNTGVSTTAFWTVSGSGSAPATVGSSGCTSGVDVSPASGSTFVGANSSAVITLTTCNLGGGNVANEQFTVSLSSSSGFVSNSTAIGTFNQT